VYGALMSHPTRVPRDQALGDIRGFRRSLPAQRALLAEATPFAGEIAPSVPVTIAWAARDLVLPPWQGEVARAVLPHAEHLSMRGVGHVPMWDDPRRVARILLRGSAPVVRLAPLTVVDGPAARTRRVASA
jgi:pimeloyl-ACP methyl ester carboxylesterase